MHRSGVISTNSDGRDCQSWAHGAGDVGRVRMWMGVVLGYKYWQVRINTIVCGGCAVF